MDLAKKKNLKMIDLMDKVIVKDMEQAFFKIIKPYTAYLKVIFES